MSAPVMQMTAEEAKALDRTYRKIIEVKRNIARRAAEAKAQAEHQLRH